MKALPFLALCLILLLSCKRDKNNFTVLVKNTGLVLPVKLLKADTTGTVAVDSLTKVAKGDFRFMVSAEIPSVYYLQSGDQLAEFIAAEGDTIIIDLNSEKKVVKEAAANAGFRDYILNKAFIEKEADSLADLFVNAQLTDSFPLIREKINNKFNGLIYSFRLLGEEFIKNNPSSVGIFSVINARLKQTPVFSYPVTPEVFLFADSVMKKNNPENPYSQWLNSLVTLNKRKFGDKVQSVAGIKTGETLPPVKLPGLNDLDISISPIKGQTAIVYFWDESSLSRKSTEIIRTLNERYGQFGLEIYAIAFIEDKNNWISLITLDKMWWNNMIDNSAYNSPLLAGLKLKRLPYFMVIDHNRIVLAQFSSSSALQEWLTDYFSDHNKKD